MFIHFKSIFTYKIVNQPGEKQNIISENDSNNRRKIAKYHEKKSKENVRPFFNCNHKMRIRPEKYILNPLIFLPYYLKTDPFRWFEDTKRLLIVTIKSKIIRITHIAITALYFVNILMYFH